MLRYIVTGAPGAGKTTVLGALRGRGYATVDEAATDVVADFHVRGVQEPWREPEFLDAIVALQRERQLATAGVVVQLYDRSPICTVALARYGGHPVTPALAREVDRILAGRTYERRVFFVRLLGFITPTAARRISLVDAIRFEEIHWATYERHGFELVEVPVASVAERVQQIEECLRLWTGQRGTARNQASRSRGSGGRRGNVGGRSPETGA
jgi:predicted ATPase